MKVRLPETNDGSRLITGRVLLISILMLLESTGVGDGLGVGEGLTDGLGLGLGLGLGEGLEAGFKTLFVSVSWKMRRWA